jgi:hypothetical protein
LTSIIGSATAASHNQGMDRAVPEARVAAHRLE